MRTMTVDRALSIPLHVQVRELVGEQIADGTFAPGSKLPTEVELAAIFGVHRLTVRQAMADLARSGLVDVRQGVGTFVVDAAVPVEADLGAGEWFADDRGHVQAYVDRGIHVSHRLVGVRRRALRGDAAAHLGADEALFVEILQLTDDRPAMRGLYWLDTPFGPEDLEPFEGTGVAMLTHAVGGPMYYEFRALGAVAASLEDADALEVPIGAPLLHRTGLNVDASGRPVMYVDRRFRADQIRFVTRRTEALPGAR